MKPMTSTASLKAKIRPPSKNGKRTVAIDKYGRSMPLQPSKDEPIARFIQNIDRPLLEYLLSQDDKYRLFLIALHDPAQSSLSFAGMMRRYNVSLHEIQSVYTDGQRHIGLINMANRLPRVMEDISIDALSHAIPCARCDGETTIPVGKKGIRTCPACNGRGRVRAPGDPHARSLMLETMKLVGKSSTQFVIQQNFGAGELESELALSQQIVMGDRK